MDESRRGPPWTKGVLPSWCGSVAWTKENDVINAKPNRVRGRMTVCVLLSWVGATAPRAWAQCSPLEVAKRAGADTTDWDNLGYSVSISGETMVVGARFDDLTGGPGGLGIGAGSAYVFVRSGGVWTEQAKLIASDAEVNDQFGVSVSISGDTAVVGAVWDVHTPGMPGDQFSGPGAAYVFVRSGGVWTQQAKLVASDAAAGDRFGWAVAVDGDTAVVGADLDNHAGGAAAGSAYVFVRSGGGWSQVQPKLTASDASGGDRFGWSVAIDGETALVGAYQDDHAGGSNAGSAYVFVRSSGLWPEQAKLTASDPTEEFGNSVSISGGTAVVGAHKNSHSGWSVTGAGYVFTRSSALWTQEAKLTPSDPEDQLFFGTSVSISGSTAAIGAPRDDRVGLLGAGAGYLFVRPPAGWSNITETAKLTASDAANDDFFGWSVSVSGDTAVFGAPWDDSAVLLNSGSAYVFDLNCGTPPNNNCANATSVVGGTIAFSNVGATTDGPVHCGGMGSDVWYDYMAICDGTLEVNTFGSGFDTVLNLYDGSGCVGANLGCNEDAGGGSQSRVEITVAAGQAIKIQVGGSSGAQGSGVIHVSCLPALGLACASPGGPGDMNGDGVVNGADIRGFLDCLFGAAVGPICVCADMNYDGVLDYADVGLFKSTMVP